MLECLLSNGNQNNSQESSYIKENVSEISDIVDLPESVFPINN